MNTENNTLIAEFMGGIVVNESEIYFDVALFRYTLYTKNIPFDELLYDTDWNWLMEVVEKIKTIVSLMEIPYTNELISALITVNKKAVYNACLEFIKWYNENK
jgi:hypothetical protein